MLKLHTQQHIRFAKLDKGNVWVVVAVLLETTGNVTVAISEPRVVKIIPKAPQALASGRSTVLCLPAPAAIIASTVSSVESPYFSLIFGNVSTKLTVGLAAQPPTI